MSTLEVAANVMTGTTGAVYTAPTGTALPTTTVAALNAAFREVGYISDNGVVQSIGENTTKITAWQNADVILEVETSHELQYKFTMLELNAQTLALYYGNYDGSGSEAIVQIKGGQVIRGPLVIQVVDGSNRIRIVCPDAKVVTHDDVSYKNGAPVELGVVVTCFPDTAGVKAYKYLATVGAS